MAKEIDIRKLRTSWTKYDSVKVIEATASRELLEYVQGEKKIDQPILKSFLGVKELDEGIPQYWNEIQKHPRQLRLFALLASLFTHHNNIRNFADHYAKGKMIGVYMTDESKVGTNIRSALVEAGAASFEYRREKEVPYDLSPLFENGEVGKLFKKVIQERLSRIGVSDEDLNSPKFYRICAGYNFHKAVSLSRKLFESWLEGEAITESHIHFEYSFKQLKVFQEIQVTKVNQWLNDWDDIDFKSPMRRKPDPYFIIFKIDARLLKRLSDVHRRKPDRARVDDPYVQRKHNETRTEEIKKYIEGGFPWSTIKKDEQGSPENIKLKMPGILPTAIIANIIGEGEKRGNSTIKKSDLITIKNSDKDFPSIVLPEKVFDDNWNPDVKPIEIIDGQHRLWAFDENEPVSGNYEVPVVAYFNLDRTWQAYLFYTINIKPVKINTSLGYDLYPLLRTQEWLERSKDGLLAYRENRAQEIVEVLWRHDSSPWQHRINMIGESGGPTMSQAAFIRSLTVSFFKSVRSNKSSGGLFGDILNEKNNQIVYWNRAQQAAFFIVFWDAIATSIKDCQNEWARKLRQESPDKEDTNNLAFTSKNSLLARDQGVRGLSMFANDFFFTMANSPEWDFNSDDFLWRDEIDDRLMDDDRVQIALEKFTNNIRFGKMLAAFGKQVCEFDWRTTSAIFESDEEKNNQMKFKGGSGYGEIYQDLYAIFLHSDNPDVLKITQQLK